MPDRILSAPDMDFLLYDWLKLDAMLEASPEGFDRESVDAYLDLSARLATDAFLPHYKTSDQIEPRIEDGAVKVLPEIGDALRQMGELGLFGAGFSEELGGMGLPHLVTAASYAWFAAASNATSGYAMLTGANARLIAAFGNEAQRETFALPQVEGRWFGTMCLSEPQAGSGLGDVRTRAVPDGEDDHGKRFRLAGNKMWISGGDQDISENIVHLVLAKVAGEDGTLPEGTRGISLFIVPKILPDGARNDVAVAGLNHKMGNRGTSNCLLNFGEGDGAIGWMVGEPGHGLRQMFMMMNEARVAVGIGGAALACRGYLLAVDYARERLQGRRPGETGGKPVAIIEHADVKRMLLAAKAYAEGSMALCLYCSRLVDEEKQNPDAAALLGLLTPVAKTFPAEYGLEANDLAIQVHGGYGYTRDFDVEQLWRDNRLNPIHEGTTGIQAGDLLGRKVLGGDGKGLAVMKSRIEDTCNRADGTALAAHADALAAAVKRVEATVLALGTGEAGRALDNAAPFLEAFGLVTVAWLWLDMALAAEGADVPLPFREGKRAACRYLFEHDLPKALTLLDLVASGNDLTSTATADIF